MFKFGKQFLIGFTAIGFSTVGFAQTAPGPYDAPPGEHELDNPEQFARRVERKQLALREALKLHTAQEPAWKDFTDRTRPTAPIVVPNKGQMAKLSAPERMEHMLATMREGEQRLQVRLDATRSFYAVLTPEQQHTFDRQFSGRPHHGARGASPWQRQDGIKKNTRNDAGF